MIFLQTEYNISKAKRFIKKGKFVKNKNNKNKQSGSVYIITVVILSIAILGTIGFIIWQGFGQTKTSKDNEATVKTSGVKSDADSATNNSTDSEDAAGDESDATTVDDANAKYFAIDFWNIKGIYGGSHHLSYAIPSSDLLLLDSTELPASCTSGVGRIKRFAADDYTHNYPASSTNGSANDQKASVAYAKNSYTATGGNRKVGEYYYVLTTPMQYCTDSTASNLQKAIFADVLKYFKTLKAI